MRTAGADPATPPALSATVEVGANTARTVAGVGNFADLGLDILEDDLTLPPTGQARVRVIAAAATAATLDVSLSGGAELAQRPRVRRHVRLRRRPRRERPASR